MGEERREEKKGKKEDGCLWSFIRATRWREAISRDDLDQLVIVAPAKR